MVKLNPEWFNYYVRVGLIWKALGDIPKDTGVRVNAVNRPP